MSKLPVIFLLHPVGDGATRAMSVLSAKLWFSALVSLLADVAFSAPWLPYAEAMVDGDRSLRDALVFAEGCHGVVAVGGEFNRGPLTEWDLFGRLGRPRIDLSHPPLPALLTYETFSDTRSAVFRETVIDAFSRVRAVLGEQAL